jgi:hypothetical protein
MQNDLSEGIFCRFSVCIWVLVKVIGSANLARVALKRISGCSHRQNQDQLTKQFSSIIASEVAVSPRQPFIVVSDILNVKRASGWPEQQHVQAEPCG